VEVFVEKSGRGHVIFGWRHRD